MARYVGLYHSPEGLLQEDAEVLREEGIDFEVTSGDAIENPADEPPFAGDGVLVFPDRETAETAAEYIRVVDLDARPRTAERWLRGAEKLRKV